MAKYIIAALAGIAAGFIITLHTMDSRNEPGQSDRSPCPEPDLRARIDALIKGLSLPDPADRALFHRNLVEETGMFFGFKPTALAAEREAAVGRWKEWWSQNRNKSKEQWLIESLSVQGYEGKPLAIRQLADMSSQSSAGEMMLLLDDPDSAVRREAARALGILRVQAAVDKLASLLEGDEDYQVCRAAARALGPIGSEDALAALSEARTHEDPLTRVEAASSLMLRDPERALSVLHSLLKEEDDQVRQFAITQIACLQRAESVPHLAELLASDETWATKAREALVKIVGKDLGPDKGPWVDWYEAHKNQAEHNPM
jgi:hypothetical protein